MKSGVSETVRYGSLQLLKLLNETERKYLINWKLPSALIGRSSERSSSLLGRDRALRVSTALETLERD